MKNKGKMYSFLVIVAVVLASHLPINITAEGLSNDTTNYGIALNGIIEVNRERIEAPAPYIHKSDAGIIMVPLRAIAESLGLKVVWEPEEKKIILGYGIQLWIDKAEYITDYVNYNKTNPAPEITSGRTFISLDFLRNVLEYDAYVDDGTIVIGESTASTIWTAPDGNSAWFSANLPHDYSGDSEIICVGKGSDGEDVFALLRVPLRGDWLAEEVTGARLFLKTAEGTPPSNINIGVVFKSWAPNVIQRDEVETVIRENSFVLTEIKVEENGWVSMDVTDTVKSWLSGETANRGFALFPGDDGNLGVFVSGAPGMGINISDVPRIIISGAVGEREMSFGKFGFTKQPVQGFEDPIFGGNCLSYALRDVDGIFSEDLPYTADDLNRIFFESGLDGLLKYTAAIVEDYVEANKEGLQISSFRRIDAFDSPIDPEKEYRIVFRVSSDATPNVPMTKERGFDFHLWAQLNDGRWTQKSPSVFSSVIPGTGPGISPLRFYWDAGDTWGIERWQEWYKSDGVYWAVTKDTAEFTSHKK